MIDWKKPIQVIYLQGTKICPARRIGTINRPGQAATIVAFDEGQQDWESYGLFSDDGRHALHTAYKVQNVPEKPKEYNMLRRNSDGFIASAVDTHFPNPKWWTDELAVNQDSYTIVKVREVIE